MVPYPAVNHEDGPSRRTVAAQTGRGLWLRCGPSPMPEWFRFRLTPSGGVRNLVLVVATGAAQTETERWTD